MSVSVLDYLTRCDELHTLPEYRRALDVSIRRASMILAGKPLAALVATLPRPEGLGAVKARRPALDLEAEAAKIRRAFRPKSWVGPLPELTANGQRSRYGGRLSWGHPYVAAPVDAWLEAARAVTEEERAA